MYILGLRGDKVGLSFQKEREAFCMREMRRLMSISCNPREHRRVVPSHITRMLNAGSKIVSKTKVPVPREAW